MNINNWLTTHLPLLVYVVIERPLFWKSEEKREEKKNLPLSLCYFEVRTSWHSPTCYLSDILVLTFKSGAKCSSKRNEFAYDPWVWEHKNFHGKSVFYNAKEAQWLLSIVSPRTLILPRNWIFWHFHVALSKITNNVSIHSIDSVA